MHQHNKAFKPEIQGLRAIAVVIVIIFHIWPESLPGGYVGVDVFFVISGYLITGILLREAEQTDSISLTRFYTRRIRRLMPAATAVFLVVALCHTLLPAVLWQSTAKEIIASAFYFQNWWLASEAVDYLAATNAPGPLQHYWSLSVEEQYYIVWPLLLLTALYISHKTKLGPRHNAGVLLVSIGLLSLLYSIYLTEVNAGLAYFSTATRAWEMALGGSLAVFTKWERMTDLKRRLFGFFGVALILISAFFYTKQTPFPGSAALLPTLGAALIIMAGNSSSWLAVSTLLKTRVFQYLGNISYSLYLWHWPTIIFYAAISGREIGLTDGIIIALISTALAHQSKDLIEDPFIKTKTEINKKSLILGLCLISLSIASAYYVYSSKIIETTNTTKTSDSYETHPDLQLAAIQAKEDNPKVYELGCHVDQVSSEAKSCLFGKQDSEFKVVLVGDSHAAQWVPTLTEIADRNEWALYSFTKSACAIADITVRQGQRGAAYVSCDEWRSNVILELEKIQPDLIIITQSRNYFISHNEGKLAYYIRRIFEYMPEGTFDARYEQLADGLIRFRNKVSKFDAPIVAIADTPFLSLDVPTCLSTKNLKPGTCDSESEPLLNRPDPILLASSKEPAFDHINMTQYLCNAKTCPAMIDGKIVWRDNNHITASFAKSLAPILDGELAKIMVEKE